MADISRYLTAIMAAVLGEEVRGSIHDAIDIINKAQEVALGSGTAINDGDPRTSTYFEGSLYINTSTDELLRCGANAWQAIGSIRGNGISEITGPETTGLDDEYTIHYTDGGIVKFTVHNGKGIVSVALYSQVGLVDTYRMTFNDTSIFDFVVKNGNQWYYGTAITGGSSVASPFTLPFEVKSGDAYLNLTTNEIYTCSVGAAAGAVSMWEYRMTLTAASGGTNNYGMLTNHPFINTHELTAGAHDGHDFDLANLDEIDAWLMDTSVTPAVPLEKSMPLDSTSITFSQAEMADIVSNGWAVKAYFQCDDGQAAPSLKKVIPNADGTLTVSYTKVKAAQGTVTCKLRIIK